MQIWRVLETKGREAVTVGPEDTVAETARRIAEKGRGLAVVCNAGKQVLGIVSVIDINRAVAQHGEGAPGMLARDLMSKKIAVCAPNDTIDKALETMAAHRVRHLPVVEKGALQGVVNMSDLLESRFQEERMTADEMRQYFFGVGYH